MGGLIFLILVLIWIFVIGISSNQHGSFFNKGHNAVWLEHKWVGEYSSEAEIQQLVNKLKDHDIDTVFVHSGPLEADGDIDAETYKYAVEFVEGVKRFDNNIQVQAWLGQVRGKIDLAAPEVRHNVAKQCMIFAQLIGFDGIHFDIEPVWDGDMDFIETLKECREILPEDKFISVALAEFIPESFLWLTEKVYPLKNHNSEVNYENVARYADQIVVMVYDTSIKKEWMYRWLVKEQTIRLTSLLEDKEVFIGIPAYSYDEEDVKNWEGIDHVDDIDWFDPKVENVKNGLLGIIDGLNNFRSNHDSFAGVAIYPYWEIDEEEWAVYKLLWKK